MKTQLLTNLRLKSKLRPNPNPSAPKSSILPILLFKLDLVSKIITGSLAGKVPVIIPEWAKS